MQLRVLTWNLLHGRSVPPAGRELFAEFAEALAGWGWDLALLQEVPPWWPERLSAELGVQARFVLTSRNWGLALRRWVAERWPDLIKSNGGGANAILVRGHEILEHRTQRLSLLPERRWVHAVRLGDGLWAANVHLQGSASQAVTAARVADAWAAGAPLVLGGDFNLRSGALGVGSSGALDVGSGAFDGFEWAGGFGVDHILVRGLRPLGDARVLDRGRLSDHAPVLVNVGE